MQFLANIATIILFYCSFQVGTHYQDVSASFVVGRHIILLMDDVTGTFLFYHFFVNFIALKIILISISNIELIHIMTIKRIS